MPFLKRLCSFLALFLIVGSFFSPLPALADNKCWLCNGQLPNGRENSLSICVVNDITPDGAQEQGSNNGSVMTLAGCREQPGACQGMTPRRPYTSINNCGSLSASRTATLTFPTPPQDVPASNQNGGAAAAPRPFTSINPNPSVPIPGVEFTPAVVDGANVGVPFLAQYIGGLFRFAIGLGAIVASAMVVYGGFRYLMAASLPDVKDGKDTIKDAILGLVVLLGSYIILQTINPELLNLKPLSLNVVESEEIAAVDNTGDPNPSMNPDDYGGTFNLDDSACGAGRTENHFGRPFYILPLRRGGYYQGGTPWGPIAYGPNLNESPSQSRNPCGPGGQSSACIGTIGQGGCGVASVATIAAFYGVTVSDPNANELVDNTRIWSGSRSNRQLVSISEASPRLATLLRARAQPHLFDPLDAAKLASRPGGGRVVNGGTRNLNFVRWIPGNFTTRRLEAGPNRAAEAKRIIEGGAPLLFHCSRCHMNELVRTNDPGGGFTEGPGGHFMVLYGVSQDGQHFLIHDVGWSSDAPRKGFTLSAQELNTAPGNRLTVWAMQPQDRTIQNCGNPVGGAGAPAGGAGVTAGGPVAAGVRRQNFTYRPPEGDAGWQENQAALFFPERLMNELNRFPTGNPQRQKVRLFIFIHGSNDDMNSFTRAHYPAYMQNALQEIATRKNVVIATPHYMGTPYLHNFNLANFYAQAIAQLGATIPGFRPGDVQDVVVGAHSAGTCQTPRGLGPVPPAEQIPPILQAVRSPLPNQIGLIAYDGCAGTRLTPTNFRQPSSGRTAIYMNADLRGMGDDDNRNQTIKTLWTLPTTSNCPESVRAMGRAINCFIRSTPQGEIGLFETSVGHNPSIELMTKIAFKAFYP